MARSANCMARLLVYPLIPGWAATEYQACGSHRYCSGIRSFSSAPTDQAGADLVELSGWFCGHSGIRSAGGLMTEQLANDIVRDHRNSPVLLVMSNWPYSEKNRSMYPSSGTAKAVTHAVITRQPTRRTSRKARITTNTGAPFPRMTEAQERSTPTTAACQMAGFGATLKIATATTSTSVNRVSGRMEDSCQISRESNSVGAAASVAPQAGSPRVRSTP